MTKKLSPKEQIDKIRQIMGPPKDYWILGNRHLLYMRRDTWWKFGAFFDRSANKWRINQVAYDSAILTYFKGEDELWLEEIK